MDFGWLARLNVESFQSMVRGRWWYSMGGVKQMICLYGGEWNFFSSMRMKTPERKSTIWHSQRFPRAWITLINESHVNMGLNRFLRYSTRSTLKSADSGRDGTFSVNFPGEGHLKINPKLNQFIHSTRASNLVAHQILPLVHKTMVGRGSLIKNPPLSFQRHVTVLNREGQWSLHQFHLNASLWCKSGPSHCKQSRTTLAARARAAIY